jgi:hypothetical protein
VDQDLHPSSMTRGAETGMVETAAATRLAANEEDLR